MNDIPAHRRRHEARSGDTHVIGADGKVRNLDQEARARRKADAAQTAASLPTKAQAAKSEPVIAPPATPAEAAKPIVPAPEAAKS